MDTVSITKMKSIKTIVAGSAAVILGFALVAAAASYTFSNYLSVGSTGADVSALQSYLMASGYSIPSITSGAAQPGYFGSQTQTAVEAYQSAFTTQRFGFEICNHPCILSTVDCINSCKISSLSGASRHRFVGFGFLVLESRFAFPSPSGCLWS